MREDAVHKINLRGFGGSGLGKRVSAGMIRLHSLISPPLRSIPGFATKAGTQAFAFRHSRRLNFLLPPISGFA